MNNLTAALDKAQDEVLAAMRLDYVQLEAKVDPRGHGLLAVLEQHHRDLLLEMFASVRRMGRYFEVAQDPRPQLRAVGDE